MNLDNKNISLLLEYREVLDELYVDILAELEERVDDIGKISQAKIADLINTELAKRKTHRDAKGREFNLNLPKYKVGQRSVSTILQKLGERRRKYATRSASERKVYPNSKEEFFEGWQQIIQRTNPSPIRNPEVRKNALLLNAQNNPNGREENWCVACLLEPRLDPAYSKHNLTRQKAVLLLEAHHIKPRAQEGETVTNIEDDVIMLCKNCHAITHSK